MLYQLPLSSDYANLSEEQTAEHIAALKQRLGSRLVILGHHYQQDDVFRFADFTGDSLKLSQIAAEQTQASAAARNTSSRLCAPRRRGRIGRSARNQVDHQHEKIGQTRRSRIQYRSG